MKLLAAALSTTRGKYKMGRPIAQCKPLGSFVEEVRI
jgi:hypothetical protein